MKRKSMSTIGWLASICVLLVFGSYATAQTSFSGREPGGNCSNRTLFGDYGIQVEGTFLAPNWQLRNVMMAHFDGNGAFTYVDYPVVNGAPLFPDWTSNTGTYRVNPDCTATAVLGGVIHAHLVVVNNGKDFRGIGDADAATLVGSRVR